MVTMNASQQSKAGAMPREGAREYCRPDVVPP
jgi:hypothetical protein